MDYGLLVWYYGYCCGHVYSADVDAYVYSADFVEQLLRKKAVYDLVLHTPGVLLELYE